MDREANTEHYLHDLESKLDGHTTGEEKNAAIIAELRKEIARARENEASCEDYISTLEERLAEADQDMELMQREMDRLEHVIDRQRSLGKLDTLLYELDHIQQNGTKSDDGKGDIHNHNHQTPPVASWESAKARKRGLSQSLDVLMEAAETAIPESDDDFGETPPEAGPGPSEREVEAPTTQDNDNAGLEALQKASGETNGQTHNANHEYPPQSPAQSRFVAEKLEDVTQELFELRIQHETSTNDYYLLQAKYEEALRTLAELQDVVDEARHPPNAAVAAAPMTSSRPVSFLEDSRVQELRAGGQPSSSRLLSSELSLAEGSSISQEPSESGRRANSDLPDAFERDEPNNNDVENMQKLLQEHQQGMSMVTQKYAQLQSEHEETLSLVEDLKQELQRTKASSPTSPTTKAQVIRRMTSQNMNTVDRAHRSLASLRNIAIEEFEDKPDTMQNFEVSLNTAMHELHSRMERIQALEAENKNVKKEMETKATIISGLTRERSSLSGSSPMDISVVSQMRDQILQHENKLKELQAAHDIREKELTAEVQSLNELLEAQRALVAEKDGQVKAQNQKIVQLEEINTEWEVKHQGVVESLESSENKLQTTLAELQAALVERAEWQSKHRTAAESLQSSEQQLQNTMVELEAALASIDALRAERNEVEGASAEEMATAATSLENSRVKHQELVDSLKLNIDEQRSIISVHLSTISGLESSLAAAREQISRHESDNSSTNEELESYRARVTALEQEVEGHKATVEAQQAELASLKEMHKQELEELEIKVKAAAEAQHESRMAQESARNEQALNALRSEISTSKNELTKLLASVSTALNTPVTSSSLQEQIEDVLSQKQQFAEKYSALFDTNEELVKELESKTSSHAKLERQFTDLTEKSSRHEAKMTELAHLVASHEDALKEKEDLIKKKDAIINEITIEKQKSVRLVEELEEQITNTFDQHHNRLSVIQQERHQALDEANLKIVNLEKDIESYRARIEQLEGQMRNGDVPTSIDRSSSMTSNLRKSASAASLPSPPPAIPLPPLPNIAAQTGSISPPSSRHTSKELVNAQLVEDQEARIRTIEKHLHAEKQLTATLEEALGDLEAQSNKVKADMEAWKKKAWQFEDELTQLRSERNSTRLSIQAVEEERNARREAEAARAHLEEKMNAISKKKKKSTLNCF
ncbi:hypothetical protein ACJ72_02647 [Emergomyces africanus]|uniref:Uncharacterized protein n=1 Tax=Emergomyces africanus TaxID=1955775 RepID=A0A1B7P1U5_9EURO|nr:hypothetical protein ACJ72_02647 [Emergomyces africanus]